MPERRNKITPGITGYERCNIEGRTYEDIQKQTWLLDRMYEGEGRGEGGEEYACAHNWRRPEIKLDAFVPVL